MGGPPPVALELSTQDAGVFVGATRRNPEEIEDGWAFARGEDCRVWVSRIRDSFWKWTVPRCDIIVGVLPLFLEEVVVFHFELEGQRWVPWLTLLNSHNGDVIKSQSLEGIIPDLDPISNVQGFQRRSVDSLIWTDSRSVLTVGGRTLDGKSFWVGRVDLRPFFEL